jgi:ParB-like chromosome segregation protein Spo0J
VENRSGKGNMMGISGIAEGDLYHVGVNDIEILPGPYSMSFGFDIEPLIGSIRNVGLVNCPLLKKDGDEKLEIIIGYRRIHALKSLGVDRIPCRIVSCAEFTPLDCLLLNLYDNLSTRKFNEVEKGMVLRRLSQWTERDEIMNRYMGLLQLPSHERTLDFYLRLDQELDDEIKMAIINGHLSLHAAKRFLDLDNKAKSVIFKLISNLKLNINQQKQLFEYLDDISNKYKMPIADILEEETLKKICCNTRMNNPQKAVSVLRVLRSKIFPRLIEAEENFNRATSALGLPEGVRINYPPFFESPNYRLEVPFKNGKELIEKIAKLSRNR